MKNLLILSRISLFKAIIIFMFSLLLGIFAYSLTEQLSFSILMFLITEILLKICNQKK